MNRLIAMVLCGCLMPGAGLADDTAQVALDENPLSNCIFGLSVVKPLPLQFVVAPNFHILAYKRLSGRFPHCVQLKDVATQRVISTMSIFAGDHGPLPIAYEPPATEPRSYVVSSGEVTFSERLIPHPSATIAAAPCDNGTKITVTPKDSAGAAVMGVEISVLVGYKPGQPSFLGPWLVVK
jgi:hypothetical protein